MKKKKLEAKLTKTKKKLAKTQTKLDAVMEKIGKSGTPKPPSKPAGTKVKRKGAVPARKTAANPPAKPIAKPRTASRAK